MGFEDGCGLWAGMVSAMVLGMKMGERAKGLGDEFMDPAWI